PRYATNGQVAPGTYSLDWAGTKPDGSSETEGIWRWIVTAVDDLGRSSSIERRFYVNDTLGFPKPAGVVLTVPRKTASPVASFTLAHTATVSTQIETTSGVVVANLDHRQQDPGVVEVSWDGATDTGAVVYSGRFLARVSASNQFGTVELTSQFDVRRVAGGG